jgi:hypothetical protein
MRREKQSTTEARKAILTRGNVGDVAHPEEIGPG